MSRRDALKLGAFMTRGDALKKMKISERRTVGCPTC